MIYSSFVFKSKLGLVSLVILASLLSSQYSYAMDDDKTTSTSSTSDEFTNLQEAADEGEKDALYVLGCMYRDGWGVDKDENKARDLFK